MSPQGHQYITVMSLEIHVTTRQKLLPDPEFDSVSAFFYSVHNDVPDGMAVQVWPLSSLIVS